MGGQALQYVRSRHVDGASDLGRMKRQQRFLAALIDQATSSGVLLNPLKFRDVTRAVLGSVRADKGFGTDELLDLGRAMRNFSPSSSEFTTVPIGQMGFVVKGIGSTLKWDQAKAEKLFRSLRDDKPLAVRKLPRADAVKVDVAPQQIQVQVENGTAAAVSASAWTRRSRRPASVRRVCRRARPTTPYGGRWWSTTPAGTVPRSRSRRRCRGASCAR